MKIVLLYSTLPTKKAAKEIAETLLQKRLIGCAHMLPAGESFYRWKGKVVHEKEVVLLLKTTASQRASAVRKLEELHPYECPCILELPVKAQKKYAQWLYEATSKE